MSELDPALAVTRTVRHRISAEFGHDAEKLIAHYLAMQQQYSRRLVASPEGAEVEEVEASGDRTPGRASSPHLL
jgi:hypothetical protein